MQVIDLTTEAASNPVNSARGVEEAVQSGAVDAAATETHGQLQIQHQAEATADSVAQVSLCLAACPEHVSFHTRS